MPIIQAYHSDWLLLIELGLSRVALGDIYFVSEMGDESKWPEVTEVGRDTTGNTLGLMSRRGR